MPEETAAPVPPKSKKKWLLIILVAVVVLALAAAGALWYVAKQRSASLDEDGVEQAAEPAEPKTPPAFLPLDNMVVNLADPGGDRFAQMGITLELADAKTAEKVKTYMPSIRSGVLMLLSQRTSDELLSREGKEKLAADVRLEVLNALGYTPPKARGRKNGADEDGDAAPRKAPADGPVRAVLFSSFIVQ